MRGGSGARLPIEAEALARGELWILISVLEDVRRPVWQQNVQSEIQPWHMHPSRQFGGTSQAMRRPAVACIKGCWSPRTH
jgi:hypothetical protein